MLTSPEISISHHPLGKSAEELALRCPCSVEPDADIRFGAILRERDVTLSDAVAGANIEPLSCSEEPVESINRFVLTSHFVLPSTETLSVGDFIETDFVGTAPWLTKIMSDTAANSRNFFINKELWYAAVWRQTVLEICRKIKAFSCKMQVNQKKLYKVPQNSVNFLNLIIRKFAFFE